MTVLGLPPYTEGLGSLSWTPNSHASAARIPTAPTTANAAATTCGSASATAPTSSAACSPAAPARRASPNARAPPLFDSQLPEDKAVSVLQHLAESCGVRQTSRLVGVNKNTVVRSAVVAGQHAKQVHDEVVAFSPETREVQFDEKWSFVAKKEKHCDPDDPTDRGGETTGITWPSTRNIAWW